MNIDYELPIDYGNGFVPDNGIGFGTGFHYGYQSCGDGGSGAVNAWDNGSGFGNGTLQFSRSCGSGGGELYVHGRSGDHNRYPSVLCRPALIGHEDIDKDATDLVTVLIYERIFEC